MIRRILPSAMVLSLSLLASPALHAATLPSHDATPNAAVAAKGKLISFHIRNASASALVLKAGDQQITIAPGQTATMKLVNGTPVTSVNDTAHFAAGAVVTTVTEYLQGNTLAVS